MGLKSGSRDSGLEDDEEPDEGTGSEAPGDATDGAEEARDVSASDANSSESVSPTAATTETGTNPETGTASVASDSEPTESVDDTGRQSTERTEDTPESRGAPDTTESRGDPGTTNSDDETATGDTGPAERPSPESIPYVLRRGTVNEGRDQVPFFLRESVVDGERELRDELESRLGEDVYKSDYREAAMVVAQEHPELVAEVLRRWGYDL